MGKHSANGRHVAIPVNNRNRVRSTAVMAVASTLTVGAPVAVAFAEPTGIGGVDPAAVAAVTANELAVAPSFTVKEDVGWAFSGKEIDVKDVTQATSNLSPQVAALTAEEVAKQVAEQKAAEEAAREAARAAAAAAIAARPVAVAAKASEVKTEGASVGGSVNASGVRAQILSVARSLTSYRYVFGGKSKATGFDCSGFTSYVYAQVGISLPRSSSSQRGAGTVVPASQARPGDLMWWPGHVGIYTGNGMHIAAQTPRIGIKETRVWGHPIYIRVVD